MSRLREALLEACAIAERLLRDPSASIYPPDPRLARLRELRKIAKGRP